jgi:hypothetical protein
VAFRLPDDAPESLELFDITGRRWARVEVSPFGPGQHEVELRPAQPSRPGIYWIRLARGGESQVVRAFLR